MWSDRRIDDQKVEQTEARDLPIFPKFLWRIWPWIWVYTVLLMTNTLHNQSLHTGPGDPWPLFSSVFLGRLLCWWKDGSQWGQTEALATWSEVVRDESELIIVTLVYIYSSWSSRSVLFWDLNERKWESKRWASRHKIISIYQWHNLKCLEHKMTI